MSSSRQSLAPLSTLASSSSLNSIARPPPRPPVSYVLLAEFDIDEGSVLKHQYPVATGTDEHLLAEHMLPDGAHDRTEDWTVFYLNQIPGLTVDSSLLDSPNNPGRIDSSLAGKGKGRASENGSGAPSFATTMGTDGELLYVMSLVRTKKDASVRRGALVKALAVASHNPYIQIYKPILLLALEDYYKEPSIDCLSRLYRAINSMDTTYMPSLSLDERIILRTSERKDIFEEKFMGFPESSSPFPDASTSGTPSSSHLPLDRTPSSASFSRQSDGSTEVLDTLEQRSGSSGSISSLASTNKDTASYAGSTDDLSAWNKNSLARSRANTVTSSEDGSRSQFASALAPGGGGERSTTPALPPGRPKDTHWFDSKITYAGIPLPIRIPLATFPEEIGDYSLIKLIQTFSPSASSSTPPTTGPLHPHLHTNGPHTHPIILLFNALVTGKRVVFLGHGQPAGQVANLVLAACALGSGCGSVLQGFKERAFPYTNLSNLDNLQLVDGFIAGVCNPAFADRPTWWDVLCNMETGKVIVSKSIEQPKVSHRSWIKTASGGLEGYSEKSALEEEPKAAQAQAQAQGRATDAPDNPFMEEILNAIQSHYGEAVIRARFTDYVQRFVRIASRFEEDGGGSKTTIGYPCANFSSHSMRLGGGVVFVDDAQMQREMQSNVGRVEGWKLTKSYKQYQKGYLSEAPTRSFDLMHQISRLRQGRKMSDAEVKLILGTLAEHSKTDEQIVAMLAQLPSHFGGLLPLAFGLFHPVPSIRYSAVELLERLDAHPTGQKFVQSLNAFHRLAYHRLLRERRGDLTSPTSLKSSGRSSIPPVPPPKELL
ncbi:docking domain of Afi1 for Arf3 in vesicle trafficking-domain-containing protein [Leucosporidium creatinivorum]|uniref:Docking domain of Afi1 for Arf3 in vesicle trafficking-domain-containing protein n=1 Tax=Leucosporidium creatinivorum TaxID=106004 RepID=A0A1Y2G3A7_9BASI|nr:docking domain of Afi1 for Arf3 in vesicle trafficking-domain-containing protein [Leucosporidium creatinivorum]